MALMDESVWRGKIYSGGWVGGELGSGLDAPVIEPATGQEIGRTGTATPADVARAAQIAAAAQPAWATADDEPNIPFGGIGASGTGARFGGTANLDAFTDTRWVTVRGDIAPYPF
jgi:acyl-CoA reductase-like NAD-dependent aldehyde dehydrogenase